MDKKDIPSWLILCEDCGYWKRGIQTKHHGYIDFAGICNRPCEPMLERYPDDFCSRGQKRRNNDG